MSCMRANCHVEETKKKISWSNGENGASFEKGTTKLQLFTKNTHTHTHTKEEREGTLKWMKLANAWMHTKKISLRAFFCMCSSLLTSLKQKKVSLNYSYVSVSVCVCKWIIFSHLFVSFAHPSTYSFTRSIRSRIHSPSPSNFNYFLKSFVCMCCKFTYTLECISGWWAKNEQGWSDEVAWHL